RRSPRASPASVAWKSANPTRFFLPTYFCSLGRFLDLDVDLDAHRRVCAIRRPGAVDETPFASASVAAAGGERRSRRKDTLAKRRMSSKSLCCVSFTKV